jgi:hypothetical protein
MSEPGGLSSVDLQLLVDLAHGNDWMRALLCTLARRGTWLRRTDPPRARALLQALGPWPVFKAGQFLFDLLEWEDFMVNGPVPEPLPGALDAAALARITRLLQRLTAHLDGTEPEDLTTPDEEPLGPVSLPTEADLPALDPGFYLYQDVVLGVVVSVEATRADRPSA